MSIVDNLLYFIILGLPTAIADFAIWKNLTEVRLKFSKIISTLIIVIVGILFSITYLYINSFLRIIIILILLIIACYLLLKIDIKQAIYLSIYNMLIVMIGELIFSILYMIFMNFKSLAILDSKINAILINVFIALISYGLSKIRFVKKMYMKLEKLFNKLGNNLILAFAILMLFSINFLFVTTYYQVDIKLLILINTFISAIYLIIIFKIFSVENKFIKITDKYNTTLSSLKEYEEILDKYKIMNHENKNDLLMIRGMITKKEKDVDKYIDSIINTKIKDDEKVMYETSIIPSGGLRAVIYSKLLIMKDKKINSILHVDKEVRKIDLSEYSDQFVLDLCRVVSIYIDNAIEATETTKRKEIVIQLFIDSESKFNISITNTYSGTIDLSRIDSKGYTTKSSGHGYGLALASEILGKNKEMVNSRKVNQNAFTQIIIIDRKQK